MKDHGSGKTGSAPRADHAVGGSLRVFMLLLVLPLSVPSVQARDAHRNHPCWDGKLKGMLGNYSNYQSPLKWDFLDDDGAMGRYSGFQSLGGGWVDTDDSVWWPVVQKAPSWLGGRVQWPDGFLERTRLQKAAGLEVWITLLPAWKEKKDISGKTVKAGWQDHLYDDLDREVRTWDKRAPAGWTMLDEWRFFVRGMVEYAKSHGDLIDGWYVLDEYIKPDAFSREAGARVISAAVEEIKKIDPDAFVSMQGTYPLMEEIRDYAIYRDIFSRGANKIDAIPLREHTAAFPENAFLEDDGYAALPCTGLRESLECWYRLARRWGLRDPRDGKTKVLIMDAWWGYPPKGGGPYRYIFHDTPEFREYNADCWTRCLLLALSTGFVDQVRGLFYRERSPTYYWYKPGRAVLYNREIVDRVRKMKRQGYPGAMNDWGRRPPTVPRDRRPDYRTFMEILYGQYREDPRTAFRFFDFYSADRRPDGKQPVYFAFQLMMDLLSRATYIGKYDLGEERLYGLKFRDDSTGKMVSAMWSVIGTAQVVLHTDENTLTEFQRSPASEGIAETRIVPRDGSFLLELSSSPVFVVGEIKEAEWARVYDIAHTGKTVLGGRDMFEITYQSDRDMSGGEIEITFPANWVPPQSVDASREGFVTVEPGPGVSIEEYECPSATVRLRLKKMPNGHTLRVIYGDARSQSHLYDMGDDKYGLVTMDFEKMDQNMTYNETARDGFDVVGVPFDFRLRGLTPEGRDYLEGQTWASGGWGLPDNPHDSIYKDMAISIFNSTWSFEAKVDPHLRYQVRAYLAGPGSEDDEYAAQEVRVGAESFDSTRDRVFRNVIPQDGLVRVDLRAESANSIQRGFLIKAGRCRLVPLKEKKSAIIKHIAAKKWDGKPYSLHAEVIPDNVNFCYLYGLEIIPEGLGGGPAVSASTGRNVFSVTTRSTDGRTALLQAGVEVVQP